MSSARETWEKRIKVENKNPRSSDGGLGHDELRDRWLERYPGMAWSAGDWYRYGSGYWMKVAPEVVEAQVIDVLEGSKDEGVKVTGHLLGSVLRLSRAATFINPALWDSNADILVVENGTLEISTRTLREHRPEDCMTSSLPYEYDPEAKAEIFEAVISEAIPDAKSLLQEFAGYCLTIETDLETALWLKGPKGCGKSTVIEGLITMLGERHGPLGLADIETSAFALADIPGKTLLTSTEQPASYLKSSHVVNKLISGEFLTIDRKYRDAEKVRPVAKVLWAMNDLPRINSTNEGLFRRVKIVEFPKLNKIPDPDIKGYIKEEGAGILNWALDGLAQLNERGGFDFPESVLSATAEFEASNDLPAMFVEERCATGKGYEIASSLLYSNYKQWCEDGGHKAQSINRVGDDWTRLGYEKYKVGGRKFWRGVAMRETTL